MSQSDQTSLPAGEVALTEILLEIRLLRHGKLERMYFETDRWLSRWKGELCRHRRGHTTFQKAEDCLRARARRDEVTP